MTGLAALAYKYIILAFNKMKPDVFNVLHHFRMHIVPNGAAVQDKFAFGYITRNYSSVCTHFKIH